MKVEHCQHVVQIGQIGYTSLTGALIAAKVGEVLVLLDDVELGTQLRLERSITLTTDGTAPRTVRYTGSGAALELTDGCVVTGGSMDAPLIIDGGEIHRSDALIRLEGKDILLRYVRVQNSCNAEYGGGIYAAAGTNARMERCAIAHNCALAGGGGFVEDGAELYLHRCLITDNWAESVGGVFHVKGKLLPTGCRIENNRAADPRGEERLIKRLPLFEGIFRGCCDAEVMETAVYETVSGGDSGSSYAEKLLCSGFHQVWGNRIEDNVFASFTDGELSVTVMETPKRQRGTVRMTVEQGASPVLDSPSGKTVTQPVAVMLGTGCATMQNGAALLFRLRDGRYIIIDGGYTEDARQLYETMQRLAEGREIRIAAWFLTHAHGDHLEAFLAFWQLTQVQNVVLERLVLHMPSDEVFAQNIVGHPADSQWKEKISACLSSIYPAPQVICAHVGQVMHLGEATITVLCTPELIMPEEIWSFNDTSLVCMLHLEETDFLLLGDCSVLGGRVLTEIYHETLRCHVLQASHHGHYNNAPQPELYERADPNQVLWCSTWERFYWIENRNALANQRLFAHQRSGKTDVWCAGGMVRIFGVSDGRLAPLAVEPRLRDMQKKEGELMDIKLVGLDLDGTVLDDDRKVRQRTIDALRLAADHGINLAVISGRNFQAVPEEIRALPFIRYFVLCNGAGIYDRQRDVLLFQADIPLDEALALYDALDEENVYYDCYLSDGAWTPQSHYDRIDEFVPVDSHRAFLKANRKPFADFRGALRQRGKSLWKVQSIYKDTAIRDREMARLQKKFPQYTFVTSYSYNLEINMPAATKGSGLMQLTEILGLKREQVMAFGDGGNDVSMLQSAGVGVAMGNACEEVKAAANCVGPSNNEDGVAQVLEALVCGENEVRSVCQFR